MALDSRLKLVLDSLLTGSTDLQSRSAPLKYSYSKQLTSGTGANQADRLFTDQRTITASSTDSLDLQGSLTDAFGSTVTFAKIKVLIVAAAAGNTNNVNVTRPAANGVPLFLAAGDGVPVKPGGLFVWMASDAAGVAVTAGTGDLIDMVNSGAGTSVTYDVAIIGTSA